ncbi:MAG: hypothetical protein AAGE38_12785, partial [Pseudomonadota bacterium]
RKLNVSFRNVDGCLLVEVGRSLGGQRHLKTPHASGGFSAMTKVAVYTCAIGDHDWIHRPQVKPPGVDFIRFSNARPWRPMGWHYQDLPPIPGADTPRVLSRFPKLRPMDALPNYEIAIWIDASVEIIGDITPLIQGFRETDTDIALFPHPSGRTVAEEFTFAIEAGRIGPEFYQAADRQKQRYAEMGLSDRKIIEASIIFYRLPSEALREAGQAWWHEITHFTERDQVSQPYAMQGSDLSIHLWDWHFKQDNPYFRRLPHRPKTWIKRLRTGAQYLGDSRWDYRLARHFVRGAATVKRAGLSMLSRRSG